MCHLEPLEGGPPWSCLMGKAGKVGHNNAQIIYTILAKECTFTAKMTIKFS